MEHNQDPFIPETVDEQVEQLSQMRHHPETPDERLVDDIYAFYREYERSRERVWARLATHIEHTTPPQPAKKKILHYERYTYMQQSPSRPERMGAQRFAMVAAVIFATLLVGSMATVFYLVRHTPAMHPSTGGAGQSSQQNTQPQQVSTPSGIYVASDQSVARMDAQTGKTIWTYKLPATQSSLTLNVSRLIPDGDTLYVNMKSFSQGITSALLVLDAKDGHLRWSHSFASTTASDIAVANGIVYATVASSQPPLSVMPETDAQNTQDQLNTAAATAAATYKPTGDLLLLNAADGSQRSKYHFDGDPGYLTIANDVAYLTTSSALSAIRLSDGKLLWFYQPVVVNGLSLVITQPHVIDGVLYTVIANVSELASGPTSSAAAAFNADTGAKLWQSDKVDGQVFDLTVANNVVYFGSFVGYFKGVLYAYDAQQGKRLWSHPTADGSIQWTPYVADGVVYASAYKESGLETVLAVNAANGSEKWKAHIGPGIMTTPYVNNGVVYVGCGGTTTPNSNVYALKSTDGSALWKAPLSGAMMMMTVIP